MTFFYFRLWSLYLCYSNFSSIAVIKSTSKCYTVGQYIVNKLYIMTVFCIIFDRLG